MKTIKPLLIATAIALSILSGALIGATPAAAQGNTTRGTVTFVSTMPDGRGYWVSARIAGRYARSTSFYTSRQFAEGERIYIHGSPDWAGFIPKPIVWR